MLDVVKINDKKEDENKNTAKKEENKKAEIKNEKQAKDSGSSSESDSSDSKEITAEQRMMNREFAQQKLFQKWDSRGLRGNNLNKPTRNKISEPMTKELIFEKFGEDFDKAVELPELNEQKKKLMVKKMRRSIIKFSSLHIQKHMDSELRNMIEEKIDDLKKTKGSNYSKIEGNVQELILSLKQPGFYFGDDEDIQQITDVQEPLDITPKTSIDFAFFMKQSPKIN